MRRPPYLSVLPFVLWAIVPAWLFGQNADDSIDRQSQKPQFRVRVEVHVEAKHAVRQYLERAVAKDLPRQFEAALGGAGRTDVDVEIVTSLPEFGAAGLRADLLGEADEVANFDKVLRVQIRETHRGFDLLAQDEDIATGYLCPHARLEVRQPARIVEAGLDVLLAAFSPSAEFRQIPDDPDHVLVTERLPFASEAAPTTRLREGDVLIPLLRKSSPSVDSMPPQSQLIPWTILVVERRPAASDEEEPLAAGEQDIVCRVESGSRRALSMRRRSSEKQLAIAIRPQKAPVTLRLVTQTEPREPLPGCRVFLNAAGEQPNADVALGVSDESGRIELPPGDGPVQWLSIKSGDLLLAKLPVVSGLASELEVPVAEDPSRIRAVAELEALRADLVDLVARRNILLARGEAAVSAGDIALARTLADELEKLPTRAQFNQRIDSVAQSAKSPNRLAQVRINRVVEETRSVLGQYLDPREISGLRNKVVNASRTD